MGYMHYESSTTNKLRSITTSKSNTKFGSSSQMATQILRLEAQQQPIPTPMTIMVSKYQLTLARALSNLRGRKTQHRQVKIVEIQHQLPRTLLQPTVMQRKSILLSALALHTHS
jgi:hypothetical protein